MSSLACLLLLALVDAGGYVSPGKIAGLFILTLPWLWASAWIDKDTKSVHLSPLFWTGVVVGGGVLGLSVWLFAPIYVLGLCVYVVIVAAGCAVYVMQRNSKVVPEARVMTPAHLSSLLKGQKGGTLKVQTRVKLYSSSGRPVSALPQDSSIEEKVTYNQVQELLHDIVWRRASEVDVTAKADGTTVRYIIDGVLVEHEPMTSADGMRAIDYIKGLAGMDSADRRRPQSGKIVVDLAKQPLDIDVVAAGSTSSQQMRFKMVQEAVRTHLNDLGLSEEMLKRLKELNALPAGLILVSARPGNGVTSTLYSLLRDNDAYVKQLVTVEKAPEVDLENVTQHAYASADQMSQVLAGALRRDPDVVMID
ncbi:MAG: Flp pilus assembly complex ATPase component TadA, partial [Planctomycetes bacterium]|nr:Flp pilus assembly complex ATPase component TadA [Planctomycetota bacterium]